MNEYFKLVLAAKSAKKASFMYKGNKYVRKMHSLRPGSKPVAIYKKAYALGLKA